MTTLPPLPHDVPHGRYAPAPGTEYQFSISDIARAAAPLLGNDWLADAGPWGTSGTVMPSDKEDLYYVSVGDVGDMDEDLGIWGHDSTRFLPRAAPSHGLGWLADAVAVTVRLMRHNDYQDDDSWDVGRHLVTALAAHGRASVVNFHADSTAVTLTGNNAMTLTISGIDRTGADTGVTYTPDSHEGWTAALRFGAAETTLYRTALNAYDLEFAEDTADLLRAVLPYTTA
ncbi:hypothetical protein [Kitasatospora sp. NPDC098663]|uniref:hypothetical protein n=1 Tax=Kitasatospora sp. NPDC098663 TaxID=3364096 RepID=UPI0037F51706